jgi:hypothetical protein
VSRVDEHIVHGDMVCGSPFEYQMPRLDINFLEQTIIDPAGIVQPYIRTVHFVVIVYRHERSALWGNTKLMKVSGEVDAMRVHPMYNFVGRVNLKGQECFHEHGTGKG